MADRATATAATPPAAQTRTACAVVPWTMIVWPPDDLGDSTATDNLHSDAVEACVRAAADSAARDGFVVLRGAVHADALSALATTAFAAACDEGLLTPDGAMVPASATEPWRGDAFTDPRWLRLQQQILPTRAFTSVGDSPAILRVLAALFGEGVTTRRGDICRLLAPNAPAHTTRPHQDHWYVGGSLQVWTAWVPLRDCPMDTGGLAVLSQAQDTGLLPHSSLGDARQGCAVASDARWYSSDLLAGDVVLFNCLTVHRSWHNLHPTQPRMSVDYRYQPASARLDITRVDGTTAGTG